MPAVLPVPVSRIQPAVSVREGQRFTLDGDEKLEALLERICAEALIGIRKIVRPDRLEALLLGGGYGRGEGGVLETEKGDQPYNDLEFYVAIRGNRFLNRRLYGKSMLELAKTLSAFASIDVEFHIFSLAELRQSEASMFYYDLVCGHRRLWGGKKILEGCQHHREARRIPLSEGTRLLMNRGTGLLLAREKLQRAAPEPQDRDFIVRNIAKAQLALGDAVLTAFGQYHWSCRERHRRLLAMPELLDFSALDEVREHHAAGVEFKLHPRRQRTWLDTLFREHQRVVDLMRPVWLWLEGRRLGRTFHSVRDYSNCDMDKFPETNPRRNRLLNAHIFGPGKFFSTTANRHPRERILNALALMLWEQVETNRQRGAQSWSNQKLARLLSVRSDAFAKTPLECYCKLWSRVR